MIKNFMDSVRFTTWGAVLVSLLVAFLGYRYVGPKVKNPWLRRLMVASAAVVGLVAYRFIPVSWRMNVPLANTPVMPGALP